MSIDLSRILQFPLEAIFAATPNGDIGFQNDLPWRLKGDLPRFKETTLQGIVIMGAGTFKSLPKPFSDRINIVISKASELSWTACYDVRLVSSPEEAIRLAGSIYGTQEDLGCDAPRVFVGGGSSIYDALLPLCSKIHWTRVNPEAFPDQQYDTTIPGFQEHLSRFQVSEEISSGHPSHDYVTLVRS